MAPDGRVRGIVHSFGGPVDSLWITSLMWAVRQARLHPMIVLRHYREHVPLSLAVSPCPNDTFVFHALVHGLIPGAPEVNLTFADVDVTNTAAERGEFDLVKVSYAALPWLLDDYDLLPTGGALGRGCGPLVLTREAGQDLTGRTIAVPGDRTTAYLL